MRHACRGTRWIRNALLRLAGSTRGQDLIEYAMLAGFVAVGAGALIPYGVAGPITKIFDALAAVLRTIGNAG